MFIGQGEGNGFRDNGVMEGMVGGDGQEDAALIDGLVKRIIWGMKVWV